VTLFETIKHHPFWSVTFGFATAAIYVASQIYSGSNEAKVQLDTSGLALVRQGEEIAQAEQLLDLYKKIVIDLDARVVLFAGITVDTTSVALAEAIKKASADQDRTMRGVESMLPHFKNVPFDSMTLKEVQNREVAELQVLYNIAQANLALLPATRDVDIPGIMILGQKHTLARSNWNEVVTERRAITLKLFDRAKVDYERAKALQETQFQSWRTRRITVWALSLAAAAYFLTLAVWVALQGRRERQTVPS
jgi:hypothetical protein